MWIPTLLSPDLPKLIHWGPYISTTAVYKNIEPFAILYTNGSSHEKAATTHPTFRFIGGDLYFIHSSTHPGICVAFGFCHHRIENPSALHVTSNG